MSAVVTDGVPVVTVPVLVAVVVDGVPVLGRVRRDPGRRGDRSHHPAHHPCSSLPALLLLLVCLVRQPFFSLVISRVYRGTRKSWANGQCESKIRFDLTRRFNTDWKNHNPGREFPAKVQPGSLYVKLSLVI